MPYIVTDNIKHAHRITLEDIWGEMKFSANDFQCHDRVIGTKTYYHRQLPDRLTEVLRLQTETRTEY